ncbi:unnamed protein product [Sympodiomycopsis kandeliae]
MNSRMVLSSLRPLASSSRNAIKTPRMPSAIRCLATGSEPSGNVSPSSTPAPPPPAASSQQASTSKSSSGSSDPKLSSIVDQIEQLTLLQAAELVTQLKTRLNIQDIAMPSGGGGAAPAAAPAAAVEEEEKPKEKTIFSLKLKGLKDPTAKAKVIKEVKAINSTMNLVEAKKFVESAPQTLKDGLNKEDVEKLKAAVEAAGGIVEID